MYSPLNPAIALGIVSAQVFTDADQMNFSLTWSFIAIPFAGSFLALLLFEFVYKRS